MSQIAGPARQLGLAYLANVSGSFLGTASILLELGLRQYQISPWNLEGVTETRTGFLGRGNRRVLSLAIPVPVTFPFVGEQSQHVRTLQTTLDRNHECWPRLIAAHETSSQDLLNLVHQPVDLSVNSIFRQTNIKEQLRSESTNQHPNDTNKSLGLFGTFGCNSDHSNRL